MKGPPVGNLFLTTQGFATVCQTLGFKTEEDAAKGLPEENPEEASDSP